MQKKTCNTRNAPKKAETVDKEFIEFLLENGADPEITDVTGNSLLSTAVFCNALDDIDFLCEHGADINRKEDDTLLANPMFMALSFNPKVLKKLIEMGGNVNLRDSDGWSLARRTIHQRANDLLDLLTVNGAEVNEITENGETLIQYAARLKNKAAVETLIDYGSDLSINTVEFLNEMLPIFQYHKESGKLDNTYENLLKLIKIKINLNDPDVLETLKKLEEQL